MFAVYKSWTKFFNDHKMQIQISTYQNAICKFMLLKYIMTMSWPDIAKQELRLKDISTHFSVPIATVRNHFQQ